MMPRRLLLLFIMLLALMLITGPLTAEAMSCCHNSVHMSCEESDTSPKQCSSTPCAACFAPVLHISHALDAPAGPLRVDISPAYSGFAVHHLALAMERPPKVLG